MRKDDNRHFISVNGKPVYVSKEVYDAYFQPIWATRYYAQKNGECCCPKKWILKCEGICTECPFHVESRTISIYTPIGDEDDNLILEDTLADDAPSVESIVMNNELHNALREAVNQLDPEDRDIFDLYMQGKTIREIAKLVGKGKSTIDHQKCKIISKLHEAVKGFIE